MFDYFEHLEAHTDWSPSLYLTPDSLPRAETIWRDQGRCVPDYRPEGYDLAFVAGMDWQAYLASTVEPDQPVVNLVQHVRHADPSANVYPFLPERAVRICVSAEVEQAIVDTGLVNGPCFTIANAIDQVDLVATGTYSNDVFILGYKQPALARELSNELIGQGVSTILLDHLVPRAEVTDAMRRSRVSALLPHQTEGFYLPALEAMALSAVAVVPDCVGNRSFCRDEFNCLMPELRLEAIVRACSTALQMLTDGTAAAITGNARSTLARHTIARERAQFHHIVENLDQIW